jgi:predicted O-methyltransferase YrrM
LAGLPGPYDLAFLDANKREYPAYFEAILPKMNTGGIILADNLLWSGKVIDDPDDPDARILREFALKVKNDHRVASLLLPIRDGLLLIRVLNVEC